MAANTWQSYGTAVVDFSGWLKSSFSDPIRQRQDMQLSSSILCYHCSYGIVPVSCSCTIFVADCNIFNSLEIRDNGL